MSSGTALRRLIGASGFAAETAAADLLAYASEEASALLLRWAGPLREGIDSYIAAFDPDRVLLGGGLGEAAAAVLARIPGRSAWFQRPVVAARLGDRAGVIGAALAALEAAR
jgi:glucokinase